MLIIVGLEVCPNPSSRCFTLRENSRALRRKPIQVKFSEGGLFFILALLLISFVCTGDLYSHRVQKGIFNPLAFERVSCFLCFPVYFQLCNVSIDFINPDGSVTMAAIEPLNTMNGRLKGAGRVKHVHLLHDDVAAPPHPPPTSGHHDSSFPRDFLLLSSLMCHDVCHRFFFSFLSFSAFC